MGTTTVWAFKPLKELKNQTGFVACDSALAKKLLGLGLVDDPRQGANMMRFITNEKATPYKTKVMTPDAGATEVASEEVVAAKDPAE
jgi:hypothetical protein